MHRFLGRGRLPLRFPDRQEEQQPEPEDKVFYPSVRDVIEVRGLLRRGIVSAGLPAEIVDLIIDTAEYWPSVETKITEKTVVGTDGDRQLLQTPGLCLEESEDPSSPKTLPHRGVHPCRKILFDIWSHDQGWGGARNPHSRYNGSYSWFDAFVIRPNHAETESSEEDRPLEARIKPGEPYFIPTPNKLQSNIVANKKLQHHRIVWHFQDSTTADSPEAEQIEATQGRGRATLDGSAVREMKVGDSVSVWARARFPGWANYVERLSVRVFWAL